MWSAHIYGSAWAGVMLRDVVIRIVVLSNKRRTAHARGSSFGSVGSRQTRRALGYGKMSNSEESLRWGIFNLIATACNI